ncbi:isoleucine--tRNA ligase [Robiginitomaculum antarcticum]|uniref:isoleucine--tRNA ligase n=1 Tax=Robiginitomaculum antarcticum TaxID=437507 RepID=UPI0003753B5B|nr:isoleucine--tRNA ligase [Robiginitomaculum antarcticum]
MSTDAQTGRDYRETLFLPQTDFPMRAGLPKKEPEWLERWERIGLYHKLREDAKGRTPYTLHDGPPYANGHIHMGTAMNKVLKDMVVRAHQMSGFDANYVPGWDCHGLPIEWKVEEEFRGKGRAKDDVPASEFRARCREYAAKWVDVQKAEFKRLGVIGDWDNPYLTMRFESEARICDELLKIAKTGQLYRGYKPVMWSPVEQTALAEAEVEYHDRRATQIYVRFPVCAFTLGVSYSDKTAPAPELETMHRVQWSESEAIDTADQDFEDTYIKDVSVVIWTTTPWTIPANRAVCFSPSISYGLYKIEALGDPGFPLGQTVGDKLIVADKLWDNVAKAAHITEFTRLSDVSSELLKHADLDHPLKNMEGADGKFDFAIPMLVGDHVTAEAGTGFVHTAPSHGEDDYMVWFANKDRLEARGIDASVPNTMDDSGCYTDVMPSRFEGLDVIRTSGKKRGQDGKANAEVLKALVECGNLLSRGIMTLRDAHSWRSKAPVIRRATPQWFISMTADHDGRGGLREKAKAEIAKTKFWPERGRNRIGTMVADRPDWLISRQRSWGVPITLIVHEDGRLHTDLPDADAINARILAAVNEHGVDGWFDADIADLMGDDSGGWTKVTDILDVWFDSGCTHAFCLKERDDLPDRADLYLEGSDQHRGWFQSSLLESCAVYGEAPYKGVLTHGFVVDEKGYKMSKSLGNTISPEDLNKQYGAEIVRLWAASSDFTEEVKIGKEIIQTSTDAYRKLRNTLRYMIGALDGYSEADAIDIVDMPALERWVLHRLHELDAVVKDGVENHDYKKIFSTLFNFCTVDLSAFYFDIRKDALYCDPLGSTRRRACRTVMSYIFERLTLWLSPILCFTMEEVWQQRFPSEDGSVHMEQFPDTPDSWHDAVLAENIKSMRNLRDLANEQIEPMRKDGTIKSSLEAIISVFAPVTEIADDLRLDENSWYTDPSNPTDSVADYLIVSHCMFVPQDNSGIFLQVKTLSENAAYTKCPRSWKYFKAENGADITPRDAVAVQQWDAS